MKFKLSIIVVLLLACASCQKEIPQTEQQPETEVLSKDAFATASMEDRRAYVRQNLKVVAAELGSAMKELNFRNVVRAEAAKKFDGDYNVLVKTLLMNPAYGASLNTAGMRKALDAFKSLEGENFYPRFTYPISDERRRKQKTPYLQAAQPNLYFTMAMRQCWNSPASHTMPLANWIPAEL